MKHCATSSLRPTRNQSRRGGSALLLALALAACSSGPKAPEPEKLLELHREQALGYYDQGELERAEDQIRRGLEIRPDDDQLKLMLGWCRQRRGTRDDLMVAERVFRELAPRKDYRAQLGLAECLERRGLLSLESAEKLENGARETAAKDPAQRARELRGEAKAQWEESIASYAAVLTARANNSQAMNGLQRVNALLGRNEESLKWAQDLLAQTDRDIAFWEQQLARTDLRAEEEARLRAFLLDSRDLAVATHLSAATLLVKLDRKSDAAAHLDGAILLAPDQASAYSRRAQLLFDLSRFEEARANLDEFLRLSRLDFDHPDVQRAYRLRADCERLLAAKATPGG